MSRHGSSIPAIDQIHLFSLSDDHHDHDRNHQAYPHDHHHDEGKEGIK